VTCELQVLVADLSATYSKSLRTGRILISFEQVLTVLSKTDVMEFVAWAVLHDTWYRVMRQNINQ